MIIKIKMSNTKIIFLLINITLVLCNSNITTQVANEKEYIEVFYKGCERLLNATSKNCAIATLEWDFKCCYVQIGEHNKSCRYLKDDNKWIKNYAIQLGNENENEKVIIECESSFIQFCLFFILLFFIF